MFEDNFEKRLEYFLLSEAQNLIEHQRFDGSWPGGCNGPYNDPESPLRNTSHIVILLIAVGLHDSNNALLKSAENGLNYLIRKIKEDNLNPLEFRHKDGKDKTNGVIGPAWLIEALSVAARYLGRNDAKLAAQKIYRNHQYSARYACWYKMRPEADSKYKIDQTFNHQLWFASAISSLGIHDASVLVDNFIEKNLLKLNLYRDKIVYHGSELNGSLSLFQQLSNKNEIKLKLKRQLRKRTLRSKSVGYHSFNLYAIARLYEELNKPQQLRSLLIRLIEPLKKKYIVEELSKSKYSWDYNHPNLEYYYVFHSLDLLHEYPSFLKKDYFETINNYIKNSSDKKTAHARLYSLARIYLK